MGLDQPVIISLAQFVIKLKFNDACRCSSQAIESSNE